MQDLLRRLQLTEKHKSDVEAELKHLQSTQADRSQVTAEPSPRSCTDGTDGKEVKELKELNAQLIGRLSRQRADQDKTTKELDGVLGERDQLICRLDAMSQQLFDLTTINDELNGQLAVERSQAQIKSTTSAGDCGGGLSMACADQLSL